MRAQCRNVRQPSKRARALLSLIAYALRLARDLDRDEPGLLDAVLAGTWRLMRRRTP